MRVYRHPTTSPVITANSEDNEHMETLSVPVGGDIGKLPVNFQLPAFYNWHKPEFGASVPGAVFVSKLVAIGRPLRGFWIVVRLLPALRAITSVRS